MFKAAGALFSGGLLGKLLGVGRELLLAALFGTTAPVGAYRIAQTATLIPINFFTSDSLNAGFIPLYTRYKKEDPTKANILFWMLQAILTILSVFITIFLFWGAPRWISILAPGLDYRSAQMAVDFVRILALGVPFYILSSLFSYLEMGNGGYKLASLRASVQSFGLIAGTLAAFWFEQPAFLSWGFTGAYILFSLWGGALLARKGLLSWPCKWLWPDVRLVSETFWQTIRPLILLPFMLQGNIAIERAVASLMGISVVASLDYAKFITETGTLLLAVPLGLAGLSALSNLNSQGVSRYLERILPILLMVTLPISAFLAVHSEIVIQLIYGRGAFNTLSVNLTKNILLGLAIGFWAQIVGYVLIKVLNAQLRNSEAVKYMGVALGANALINIFLYRIAGPFTLGLGTSIYGFVLFILTLKALKLTRVTLPYIVWLGLGAILYTPVGLYFAIDGWIGLGVATFVFVIFWSVYVLIVPKLRESASNTLVLLYSKLNAGSHEIRSHSSGKKEG